VPTTLLAACVPTTGNGAGGGLAGTGLPVWIPLVALIAVAAALRMQRRRRTPLLLLLVMVAGLAAAAPTTRASAAGCPPGTVDDGTGPAAAPAIYQAGAAVESINPTPAMIASKTFYLGGYGIASGYFAGGTIPVPGLDHRYATGILGDGVHTRAFAVADGTNAIVLAQIETQGYFSAYKVGPYGIEDIRRHAAEQIAKLRATKKGPAIGPGNILVDSNHSHGGPDTAGVWGGVPTSYLQLVHDRTVKAIVDAWSRLQPAHLYFGTAKGGVKSDGDEQGLINNQFSYDPVNKAMDDELRVIQARNPTTGKTFITYLNWSAHPTVLGGGNTLVTADYTGVLSNKLSTLGGIGFQQVGTLGRSQPSDRGCQDQKLKDAAQSLCSLNEYAERVFARTKLALTTAKPLTGKAVVSLHSYFTLDPGTNAPIFGLGYAGYAVGAPIMRQVLPPWFTGTVIGAPLYSGRIGDILISGSPGEPYPQIPLTVRGIATGRRGYLSIGTAGDFLGYIIAPFEAYPEPIRRSILSGDPPPGGDECEGVPVPVGCPSPIDNDTYFFNVSHTYGERLICALLRGAGEAFAKGNAYRDQYSRCALFANDLALPADFDTTVPTGPYFPVGGGQ
jgi:hypothetical protein